MLIKDIEFIEKNPSNLLESYVKLNEAINSNNIQSIWKLSKVITRNQLTKELLSNL